MKFFALEEVANITNNNERVNLKYEVHSSGDIGSMIIEGIVFPRKTEFDPLGKLWASVRKSVRSEYGIDIVGIFAYDEAKSTVMCSFYLSYSLMKNNHIGPKTYVAIFEDNFSEIAKRFYCLIVFFVADKDGYDKYCSLQEKGAKKEDIDRMFNMFLRSINMRNDKAT